MLSNSCKYAIRSILYLAINGSEAQKISSKTIAEEIEIPAPFLAKILQTLSKEKIICSSKGPRGGFYLTNEELSKNLFEVVKCIDGESAFKNCLLGLHTCSDSNPCSLHSIMKSTKEVMKKELQHKTIKQYAEEVKAGESHLYLS